MPVSAKSKADHADPDSYDAGYDAFNAGRSCDCPYSEQTNHELIAAWRRGWEDAEAAEHGPFTREEEFL